MPSVLVIDDDELMRGVFERAFSLVQFAVEVAPDAALALMKLETTAYDVITVDLMMSGMSGLDFLLAYHDAYPDSKAKIIVMSNIDNPAVVEKVKATGVDGYFVKSNQEPQVVVAFVKSLLDGPAATSV